VIVRPNIIKGNVRGLTVITSKENGKSFMMRPGQSISFHNKIKNAGPNIPGEPLQKKR